MNWQQCFRGRLRKNEFLARHTSFKIGGPVQFWVEPGDREELADLVNLARKHKMPLRIRVNTAGAVGSFTVWDSLRTQTFVVEVADEPASVVLDPKHKILADITEVTGSSIEDPAERELAFLAQNAPNPFKGNTMIEFGLPREQRIALRVFDIEGRMLRTLERGLLPAGNYRIAWDGRDDRGRLVAPGVYFYQLVSSDGVQKKRMLLIR